MPAWLHTFASACLAGRRCAPGTASPWLTPNDSSGIWYTPQGTTGLVGPFIHSIVQFSWRTPGGHYPRSSVACARRIPLWLCVNGRRSGSHRRLAYHGFPDTRGRERPRAWLTLVGVDKVQRVGHLAHRGQHLLAEQPQAGHPLRMATGAMGVPEAKNARAQHFNKLAELRDDGLRGPHDDLLIVQLGLVARVNLPLGFRNIFWGVRWGDPAELLPGFGVGEHAR